MTTSFLHSVELHVLLALADGPKHGHGVKLDVRDHTDGKIDLGPGTLYGAIQRLAERDRIREVKRDERRRYYGLTPDGERILRAELERLQGLIRIATAKGLFR